MPIQKVIEYILPGAVVVAIAAALVAGLDTEPITLDVSIYELHSHRSTQSGKQSMYHTTNDTIHILRL